MVGSLKIAINARVRPAKPRASTCVIRAFAKCKVLRFRRAHGSKRRRFVFVLEGTSFSIACAGNAGICALALRRVWVRRSETRGKNVVLTDSSLRWRSVLSIVNAIVCLVQRIVPRLSFCIHIERLGRDCSGQHDCSMQGGWFVLPVDDGLPVREFGTSRSGKRRSGVKGGLAVWRGICDYETSYVAAA